MSICIMIGSDSWIGYALSGYITAVLRKVGSNGDLQNHDGHPLLDKLNELLPG